MNQGMTDIFSQKKRSQIMSRIGPKDSGPEKYIRSLLYSMGYRYRLHVKDLPGNPDIVLRQYQKVIFVNGCFWHGHKGCSRASLPSTNPEFWKEKISRNTRRDAKNYRKLKRLGWHYFVVWQCGIKKGSETKLRSKLSKFLSIPK